MTDLFGAAMAIGAVLAFSVPISVAIFYGRTANQQALVARLDALTARVDALYTLLESRKGG